MIKIREFEYKDYDNSYRLLSDSAVMQYLEPPFSEERTREFLNEAGMSDSPLIYAVDVDNAFAGYVIYHDFDENSKEIGWVLFPEYWGKGIATKLTEILIEKTTAEKKDVVIECVKEQEITKHIAEKFGFSFECAEGDLNRYRLKRKWTY